MGKKKQAAGSALGRSVIKDRFGSAKSQRVNETFLHTSELKDGYDWGRLNLQSVTEQSNLEDFLSTAELAGTEFTAEKLNIEFVKPGATGLLDGSELSRVRDLHKKHASLLRIPRRPPWTKEMSSSALDQQERMAFLDWRRSLAQLQEMDGIVMTPYEKNLDFWRQLWRVIERSDIVVQIVDARNPLLFYCPDLETYVQEVDSNKVSLVLINKADFLSQKQRDMWAAYFSRVGVRVAFWSALNETARQAKEAKEADDGDDMEENSSDVEEEDSSDMDDEDRGDNPLQTELDKGDNSSQMNSQTDCTDSEMKDASLEDSETVNRNATDSKLSSREPTDVDGGEMLAQCSKPTESSLVLDSITDSAEMCDKCTESQTNTGHIYTGPELLDLFRSLHVGVQEEGLTTVGMVGYPNVGKSSTINAILTVKKVPVSATPGRTKHFQTLYVDPTLMLCDCPGLVFPSFVNTKADLVVSGILPIDQMRDSIPPVALVCQQIPRVTLTRLYGFLLPNPDEGEDQDRPPTAHEVLNAYGAMRGYMTARGVPDGPRAARYILKDYVNGRLLYCHSPPDVDPLQFGCVPEEAPAERETMLEPGQADAETDVPVPSKVDKDFFRKVESKVHARSAHSSASETASPHGSQASVAGKPWKHHNNRRKKEKLRRVYGHLDE